MSYGGPIREISPLEKGQLKVVLGIVAKPIGCTTYFGGFQLLRTPSIPKGHLMQEDILSPLVKRPIQSCAGYHWKPQRLHKLFWGVPSHTELLTTKGSLLM